MGNYSGTIRCGHCYEQGHNRAGCTTLTEELQRRFDRYTASDISEGYSYDRCREQLAKRLGKDPATGEKTRRRRKTYGGRICSYCQDNGHNRRTCEKMKSDKVRFTALSAQRRSDALTSMREHGLGIGALVSQNQHGTVTPHLVTGILWDMIHGNSGWPHGVCTRRLADNRSTTLPFPSEVTGSNRSWDTVKMLSPAHAVQAPAGWEEAANLNLESTGLFNKGEARDYCFWRPHDRSEQS